MSTETTPALERGAQAVVSAVSARAAHVSPRLADEIARGVLATALDIDEMARAICPLMHAFEDAPCIGCRERAGALRTAIVGKET
ncbi:hypothetical protein GCM10027059_26100 [Myceligenerans halotolerans]